MCAGIKESYATTKEGLVEFLCNRLTSVCAFNLRCGFPHIISKTSGIRLLKDNFSYRSETCCNRDVANESVETLM